MLNKLSEAMYSSLYRAVDIETQDKVVMKIIRTDQEEDGIPSAALREISILQQVDHPNIIHIRDIYFENNNAVLIFESMFTDLGRYLTSGRALSYDLLLSYSYQILCGILFLHKRGIVHRDITPSHLLINKQGFIKLSHFSSAQTIDQSGQLISPSFLNVNYKAPELLIDQIFPGIECDLWSAGCVIAQMASGHMLFNGDSTFDQIIQICKIVGIPSEEDWPDFHKYFFSQLKIKIEVTGIEQEFNQIDQNLFSLIKSLLTMNPSQRITAFDAVHHPVFASIPQVLIDICLPL